MKQNTNEKLGKEVTKDTKRSINFAIKKLTGSTPAKTVDIRKSSWCMVQLVDKVHVKKLLLQKVVYDPLKDILIVFRQVKCKPSVDRVFEVIDIEAKEDLVELETVLVTDGHRMVVKSISADTWRSTSDDPVVWKIEANDEKWIIPKTVKLSDKSQRIKLAQTCNFCHADDHSSWYCQWPKTFPNLLLKKKTQLRK